MAFVFPGSKHPQQLVAGFIITRPNRETSISGVFAAGDVRLGSTKQAASAVNEGKTAALMGREYLKTL
jgi:thioredoxin reductase (NADPH)